MAEETPVRDSGGAAEPPADARLDSWKEIATYLKRDVKTVQRWERSESLPVHRHPHLKRGSVYAFKPELDAWWCDGHARLEALEAARAEQASPLPSPLASLLRSAQRPLPLGIGAAVLVAALLLGLNVGGLRGRLWPRGALTERDFILVADFVNTTGDPVFDGTLKQALTVKLEETPFLNLVSDVQVAQTLRLMERSPGEPLTHVLAHEVCQRRGATAVVEGAIAALGESYVLTLNADNCRTGESLGREQAAADSKEKVLDTLGGSANRLRRKLGESLASVQRFDTPLPEATTSSLEALKAYTLGGRRVPEAGWAESIPHFRRAIELDPNFAGAYRSLGVAYRNLGELENAERSITRAYELRDRASERERLTIEMHYFSAVHGDVHRSIEVLKLQQIYPRQLNPANNLSVEYRRIGRYREALESAREARELSPDMVHPYANLAAAYLMLNRPAEAKTVLEQALKRFPGFGSFRVELWRVAFIEGDEVAMRRQAEALKGRPEEVRLLEWQTDAAVVGGQAREARRLRSRAVELARTQGQKEVSASLLAWGAMTEAWMGYPREARQLAAAALEAAPGRPLQMQTAFALAFAGERARAEALAEQLAERFPYDTLLHNLDKVALTAYRRLEQGDPAGALELLDRAEPYEMTAGLYVVYLRGLAHLKAGSPDKAAAEFRRVLENVGVTAFSPTRPLAQLGLARAYAQMGETAPSRKAYEDLFALWKDADPDLPPLQQAKAEYAALQESALNVPAR